MPYLARGQRHPGETAAGATGSNAVGAVSAPSPAPAGGARLGPSSGPFWAGSSARHSQGATGAGSDHNRLLAALATLWAWASPGDLSNPTECHAVPALRELLGVAIHAGRTDWSAGQLGLPGSLGGEKPVFIK